MSEIKIPPSTSERVAFQRGLGSVLFADLNRKTMADISSQPLYDATLPNTWFARYPSENNPSANSLSYTVMSLQSIYSPQLNTHNRNYEYKAFRDMYGISDEEYGIADKYAYDGGIAELQFPWAFSGATAAAVVEKFEIDGHITTQQRANLALKDWANVIGSVWFSSLMTDMSITRNGIYRTAGEALIHYSHKGYKSHLTTSDPIFETGWTAEEFPAAEHLTAKLTPSYRRLLRRELHSTWAKIDNATSSGCPAARKKAVLHEEVAAQNTHVQQMVAAGASRYEPAGAEGHVAIVHEHTSIELSLITLADKLDEYADTFGDPLLIKRLGKLGFSHHIRKPTMALVR